MPVEFFVADDIAGLSVSESFDTAIEFPSVLVEQSFSRWINLPRFMCHSQKAPRSLLLPSTKPQFAPDRANCPRVDYRCNLAVVRSPPRRRSRRSRKPANDQAPVD